MELLIEIIGWSGSVILLAAYGLNTYKKISPDSAAFLLMNIIGGIFFIIYSIQKEAFASTFINIIWVLIPLPALVRMLRRTA